MNPSPFLLPGIFCMKHLNWILKTADLAESSGRLDETPAKNGETVGMGSPQTRQSGRLADRREWQRKGQTNHTDKYPGHALPYRTDAYTRTSGHFTCRLRFKYVCNAYILSLAAKSGESAVITIILLLSVINRQAGASVEEGFKCLFT